MVEKAFGLEIPQSLEEACDPRKLALLVYDMQVGILRQLQDPSALTARVLETLETARGAGVPIFFLRHLSLPRPLMGIFQLRQAMVWQRVTRPDVRPWFRRDSPGFELVTELRPRSSEAMLDKITFSAFEGTPLEIALRDSRVNAFAICGVATEIGIEPPSPRRRPRSHPDRGDRRMRCGPRRGRSAGAREHRVHGRCLPNRRCQVRSSPRAARARLSDPTRHLAHRDDYREGGRGGC